MRATPASVTVAVTARLGLALLLLVSGCAAPARPPRAAAGGVAEGTPDGVNLALARARGERPGVLWSAWSPEAFERARREHKFILIDGAAGWCHWCHVMDETTYQDEEVGRILAARFVPIRVDIDERPDLGERYGEWGWPATIVLTPEAEELGKYRGYLRPEELRRILGEVTTAAAAPAAAREGEDGGAPLDALGWVGARAARDMDGFYDEKQGGWGMRQKAPLGANVEFELLRHAHGRPGALERALFSLRQQRALFDPVWGGVYQYSVGGTWQSPHYEKLMTVQAAQIEAYARGYQTSGDPSLLSDARSIARYVETFLRGPSGGFLVSQDADLNGHDARARFVDGATYYARGDAERRALGVPRVDDHVYPHENGLAIAALAGLFEASREGADLAPARAALALVEASDVGADGAVSRPLAGGPGTRFLADAAAFGRGAARLAEVTGEAGYRELAVKIARAMLRDFDDEGGALFERTRDPDAAGVFSRRERPFVHNVTAARFLAALFRLTGDASYRERGRRVLAAVASPRGLDEQGRMLGGFLLAASELGVYPWASP